MPEFSQNCLDCITNSLSNLNDANSNSNLRCGNSAHNVPNEGILSFFKNIDNSSYDASDLELLAAFLEVTLEGEELALSSLECFQILMGGLLV